MADDLSKVRPESEGTPEGDADDADTLKDDDAELLEEALERFRLAEEASNDTRKAALDDIEFAAGKQWSDQDLAKRREKGRPALTINRIPQFVRQITNDQRQNRPAIQVHPVDDDADVKTAKIIQGLIRHIEYNSNADTAYDTGMDGAVKGGFGYWRVVTAYVSPKSFDQEIQIKRIPNPFSVYFDPHSTEPDGSDAAYAFIIDTLSKDEFKSRYPDATLSQSNEWESTGDTASGWIERDSARIAEYFYKEEEEKEVLLLSNGQSVLAEDLAGRNLPEGLEVVKKRTSQIPVIKWVKLTATEVLEKTDWPGSYIPVVPVYGEEQILNGKRMLKGIVRDAKDAQRQLNYMKSAEVETIGLAPKAPFIAPAASIEGYEREWETANTESYSILTYNAFDSKGQPLPAPQRQSFEPAIMAITRAASEAADDLKATTGIYDASLGAQARETSGIAIQKRNVQSQTSNFHFVDNLTRSIRHTGRILIDLIPHIYDTARTVRIVGDEGVQEPTPINQPIEGEMDPETGQPLIYSLDVGQYDCTVDVGPSYASKRQEAAASMMDLAKSDPALMQIAGDLLVKNMDWPGAQEIADRMKKMLPPQLQEQDKNAPPIPPQIQQQMAQQGQMVSRLTQELHAAHDILDQKRMELESRERIEMSKINAQLEIAMLQTGSKESLALLQADFDRIKHQLEILHSGQALEMQGEPEQPMPPQGGMPLGAPPMQQPPQSPEQPGQGMPGQPPMEGPNQ